MSPDSLVALHGIMCLGKEDKITSTLSGLVNAPPESLVLVPNILLADFDKYEGRYGLVIWCALPSGADFGVVVAAFHAKHSDNVKAGKYLAKFRTTVGVSRTLCENSNWPHMLFVDSAPDEESLPALARKAIENGHEDMFLRAIDEMYEAGYVKDLLALVEVIYDRRAGTKFLLALSKVTGLLETLVKHEDFDARPPRVNTSLGSQSVPKMIYRDTDCVMFAMPPPFPGTMTSRLTSGEIDRALRSFPTSSAPYPGSPSQPLTSYAQVSITPFPGFPCQNQASSIKPLPNSKRCVIHVEDLRCSLPVAHNALCANHILTHPGFDVRCSYTHVTRLGTKHCTNAVAPEREVCFEHLPLVVDIPSEKEKEKKFYCIYGAAEYCLKRCDGLYCELHDKSFQVVPHIPGKCSRVYYQDGKHKVCSHEYSGPRMAPLCDSCLKVNRTGSV